MPEEADRGFKFNGSWRPAKEFLRDDSARCMSTLDPRRTKSSSNLRLDYESTRIEEEKEVESNIPTIEESKNQKCFIKPSADDLDMKVDWMNAHLQTGWR